MSAFDGARNRITARIAFDARIPAGKWNQAQPSARRLKRAAERAERKVAAEMNISAVVDCLERAGVSDFKIDDNGKTVHLLPRDRFRELALAGIIGWQIKYDLRKERERGN
jgi:hypothetical protein